MYCLKFNARVVQRILYGNLVDFPLGVMSLGWAKLLNLNKTDSPHRFASYAGLERGHFCFALKQKLSAFGLAC